MKTEVFFISLSFFKLKFKPLRKSEDREDKRKGVRRTKMMGQCKHGRRQEKNRSVWLAGVTAGEKTASPE